MADRRDDPNTFDPRFDPKYQPGYDPRADPSAAARGPDARGAVDARGPVDARSARPDARPPTPGLEVPAAPVPLAQSGGASGPGVPMAGGRAAGGAPPAPQAVDGGTVSHAAGGGAAGAEHPSEPSAGGTNPFIVVLWALSALFVIVGFGLLRWIQTSSDMQTVASSYYIVLSVQFGAPMLIILGLATATGLLFLQAVAWRRQYGR